MSDRLRIKGADGKKYLVTFSWLKDKLKVPPTYEIDYINRMLKFIFQVIQTLPNKKDLMKNRIVKVFEDGKNHRENDFFNGLPYMFFLLNREALNELLEDGEIVKNSGWFKLAKKEEASAK